MDLVDGVEKGYENNEFPEFRSGDTVKVHIRVVEGQKERIQVFQGTIIKMRGKGTGKTFTVRKISGGLGVERVFPYHSPSITKVEVVKQGKVRRAKLYYLRDRTGKGARIKEMTGARLAKKREALNESARIKAEAAAIAPAAAVDMG